MRPRERSPHDDPQEWMNRAHSNLARAKMWAEGMYLEDFCFDAQQAAEKAIRDCCWRVASNIRSFTISRPSFPSSRRPEWMFRVTYSKPRS